MQSQKNGSSPYQKYQKAPYGYSEPYQQWKAAVLRNDRKEIANQAQRHNRMFGLFMPSSPALFVTLNHVHSYQA